MLLRGHLLLFLLTYSVLTVDGAQPTAFEKRDKEAGYWLDAVLDPYYPWTGFATFNCYLKLFKRNVRPAKLRTETGESLIFDTIPARPGDNNSNELISNEMNFAGNTNQVAPGEKMLCEMQLGDGRTDRREIHMTYLDESPFVYIESSKYPEMETLPYGKSFYLILAYFGKGLRTKTEFSYCDPKVPECEAEPELKNYEEYPYLHLADPIKKTYFTGYAAESGYYTFTVMTDQGNASVYYHLKVADPVPALWSEETTAIKENETLYVQKGDRLYIPCTFTSPVPYKNKVHWFEDGYRRRDYLTWIKTTDYGSYVDREKARFSDTAFYNCTIEFIDWSKKIAPLARTFKVVVTNDSAPVVFGHSTWTVILVLVALVSGNI